jgi:dienelactone hydrolase
MLRIIGFLLGGLVLVAAAAAAWFFFFAGDDREPPLPQDIACRAAIYRTADGALIDIGNLSTGSLRWRAFDGRTGRISEGEDGVWSGTTGWSDRPNPARFTLGECGAETIQIAGIEGVTGEARRLEFEVTETQFEGVGETLAGRLVMPQGEGPFPLVVTVHGSEDYSARDYYSFQRMLPAEGIAVFVYDKRGTGGSSGEYTQDFDLLAGDAAAAFAEAQRLAGDRISSAGYQGGSQGGWIAPHAASMSDPDFVIASFGMAEGPLAEDREEALLSLIEAGYGDDAEAMAGARALAEAAGRVFATDFREGKDELAALKDQYRDEPWFDVYQGEFSHELLVRPIWQVEMVVPFMNISTSWEYEPRPVLEAMDMESLWVFAAEDREAPPDTSIAILAELQADGALIDVAVFPDTDHGIIEFEVGEDGERTSLRYADGYYRLIVDWVKSNRFEGEYGRAALSPRLAPYGYGE